MAALAYAYVGFVGIRYSKNTFEKIVCVLTVIIGIIFIGLLLIPGSPAQLSTGSIIFLIAWTVLGILFYNFGTKRRKTN